MRTRKCSAYARGVNTSVHAQIDTQQHNQSRSRFTAALLCCQVHGVRSYRSWKTARVRKTNPAIIVLILNICYLPQHYWATPFKIHTPPVEDFGKVYHSGSISSQMRFLDKVYHRESKYLIQKCQMSVFTWNSHSTMLDVYWIFHRGVWNSYGVAHCLHLSTKPGPWQRNFVDARFPQFHMFPTVWSCATTIGLPEFYIRVRLKVTFTVT